MIVLICPSRGKSCGIARYTEYVQMFLRRSGRSVVTLNRLDALATLPSVILSRVKHVIVQHEYGLWDGDVNARLWAGESTHDAARRIRRLLQRGVRVTVLMHTVDYLSPKLRRRTDILLGSGAEVATLSPIGAAALGMDFFEHGVPLFLPEQPEPWGENRLMHFGLLSGLKRVDLLFSVAEELGLPLDANLAGGRVSEIEAVRAEVARSSLPHRVTFGFLDEASMLMRWRGKRGVFLNPQADIRGYFASSGSTRFAMNFGCPIVVTGYIQHSGLQSVTCVREEDLSMHAEQALKLAQSRRERVHKEATQISIQRIYANLIGQVGAD